MPPQLSAQRARLSAQFKTSDLVESRANGPRAAPQSKTRAALALRALPRAASGFSETVSPEAALGDVSEDEGVC